LHIRSKWSRDDQTLRRLIILYNATQCSFGRTQGTIQHVDVDLSSLVLGFQSAADFKPPALIIGTIRARHELFMSTLEGKPSLEVILLRRSKVEGARNDGDDPIRYFERLVEFL